MATIVKSEVSTVTFLNACDCIVNCLCLMNEDRNWVCVCSLIVAVAGKLWFDGVTIYCCLNVFVLNVCCCIWTHDEYDGRCWCWLRDDECLELMMMLNVMLHRDLKFDGDDSVRSFFIFRMLLLNLYSSLSMILKGFVFGKWWWISV